jgi:lactoylglutathione lyase
MAFIDLGDQFLALQKGRRQPPDDGRHFGLVVDDKDAVREALAEAGVTERSRADQSSRTNGGRSA